VACSRRIFVHRLTFDPHCEQAAPESVLARYEELAALDARAERGNRMESGLAQVRASMLR